MIITRHAYVTPRDPKSPHCPKCGEQENITTRKQGLIEQFASCNECGHVQPKQVNPRALFLSNGGNTGG